MTRSTWRFFVQRSQAVAEPQAFGIVPAGEPIPVGNRLELFLGAAIGAITFSGSVIAFGKLSGTYKFRLFQGAPVVFPGQHMLNLVLGLVTIALGLAFMATGNWAAFFAMLALAFVMVFFVVFGNAFQGVREADRAMIANAQILGASPMQITRTVIIPSALSWILASLHVSFGFALVGAVVGEFLGARQGMGLLISTAQGAFNASGVFAAMIVLAVVALIADFLLTRLEKRLLKWRPAVF